MAWKNQNTAPAFRSCKHLRERLGEPFEKARCALGGATLAIVRATNKTPISVLLAQTWDESTDPSGWLMSEKLDGVRAFWNKKFLPFSFLFLSLFPFPSSSSLFLSLLSPPLSFLFPLLPSPSPLFLCLSLFAPLIFSPSHLLPILPLPLRLFLSSLPSLLTREIYSPFSLFPFLPFATTLPSVSTPFFPSSSFYSILHLPSLPLPF